MAADPISQVEAFAAGLKTAGWSEEFAQCVEIAATKTFRAIADTTEIPEDDLARTDTTQNGTGIQLRAPRR
jgi:hypothetical protein